MVDVLEHAEAEQHIDTFRSEREALYCSGEDPAVRINSPGLLQGRRMYVKSDGGVTGLIECLSRVSVAASDVEDSGPDLHL